MHFGAQKMQIASNTRSYKLFVSEQGVSIFWKNLETHPAKHLQVTDARDRRSAPVSQLLLAVGF